MSVENLRYLARAAVDAQPDQNSRIALHKALDAMVKEIIALRKEVDDLKQKQG